MTIVILTPVCRKTHTLRGNLFKEKECDYRLRIELMRTPDWYLEVLPEHADRNSVK